MDKLLSFQLTVDGLIICRWIHDPKHLTQKTFCYFTTGNFYSPPFQILVVAFFFFLIFYTLETLIGWRESHRAGMAADFMELMIWLLDMRHELG